jgi:hypothetical protein
MQQSHFYRGVQKTGTHRKTTNTKSCEVRKSISSNLYHVRDGVAEKSPANSISTHPSPSKSPQMVEHEKHNSMPVQELPKRESPQTESLPNNMSKQKEGSTSKASQSVLLRRVELVDKRQLLEAAYGAGAVADKLFAPELMEAVHVVSDSGSMTTVRLAPCAAACVAFFSEYDPSIVGLGDDENEDDDDDDDNDDDSKGEDGGGAEAGEIGEGVAGTNSVGGAFDFGEYFGVEDNDEDIRMHRRLHAAAVKVQSVVRMRSLQVGVRKLVTLPPLCAACVSFGFCYWCFRC